MLFLSPDGLIGRVLEVNPLSAEVLLVCDPLSSGRAHFPGVKFLGVVLVWEVPSADNPVCRWNLSTKMQSFKSVKK